MAQVTRVFETHEKAERAAAKLRAAGFVETHVALIRLESGGSEGTVATALVERQVGRAFAEKAATLIAGGATAVTVAAPFGHAARATAILEQEGPVAVDAPDSDPPTRSSLTDRLSAQRKSMTSGGRMRVRAERLSPGPVPIRDDPAPLSRKLGWPVLLHSADPAETGTDDAPAPLSDRFGWSVLSNRRPNVRLLPEGWFLSSRLGLPLLSSKPAPLSHAVGARTLSDDPAPLSRRTGWRVLLDDPAPLSRRLGWRTLLDDPAPLSRMLGLPVLSGERAPPRHKPVPQPAGPEEHQPQPATMADHDMPPPPPPSAVNHPPGPDAPG